MNPYVQSLLAAVIGWFSLLLWCRAWTSIAIVSSFLIRAGTIFFLRWIPGKFGVSIVPMAFFLYLVPWIIQDRKLDKIERLMGKNAGGVMGKQKEELKDWQKVEGDGGTQPVGKEADVVVSAKAEVGDEVIDAAKERQGIANGGAANHIGKEEEDVTDSTAPSTTAETKPGLSYAAVAAPAKEAQSVPSKAVSAPIAPTPPIKASTSPPLAHSVALIKPPKTHPLLALPFGQPSRSRVTNRFSLLVNAVMVLACLDCAWRPLISHGYEDLNYSRVGAVSSTWVKIAARVPPLSVPALTAGLEEGEVAKAEQGARLIYRPTRPVQKWMLGPMLNVSSATDWNGVLVLSDLWPGTEYEYRLTLPASPTTYHPGFPAVGYFKTFPDPILATTPGGGSVFTFGTSSCIKPGFPAVPFGDVMSNTGAEQVVTHARKHPLDFSSFWAISFVYADAPFSPGTKASDFFRKYRQAYAGAWGKVSSMMPTLHIYDDHEIANDWSAGEDSPVFQNANSAYRAYQGAANYDHPQGIGENYYWFRHGDAAFFVWDARRYRSGNREDDGEGKTMLGEKQKAVFLNWLAEVNSTVTFKFVVSSTPMMSLWHGEWTTAFDTWAAFVHERSSLLDVMEYVPNLVVLSGDRHEFAAAWMRGKVLELSTSPLNQFYLPTKTLKPDNAQGKTGEDALIEYYPRGNHKFTTISVDTRVANAPKLLIKLIVDGKTAWNKTYAGTPVRKPARQIGSLLPSLAEWLSWRPVKLRRYVVEEHMD